MSRSELSRRDVLRVLSWLAALGTLPLHADHADAQPIDPPEGARWRALSQQQISAASLGAQYVRQQPGEGEIQHLLSSLGLPRGVGAVPDAELKEHRDRLRRLHREDFLTGRVYELSGWILSRTELRLAALVHLAR